MIILIRAGAAGWLLARRRALLMVLAPGGGVRHNSLARRRIAGDARSSGERGQRVARPDANGRLARTHAHATLDAHRQQPALVHAGGQPVGHLEQPGEGGRLIVDGPQVVC